MIIDIIKNYETVIPIFKQLNKLFHIYKIWYNQQSI